MKDFKGSLFNALLLFLALAPTYFGVEWAQGFTTLVHIVYWIGFPLALIIAAGDPKTWVEQKEAENGSFLLTFIWGAINIAAFFWIGWYNLLAVVALLQVAKLVAIFKYK